MSRLEACKTRFEDKQKTSQKERELTLLYQEIMNFLPTYKEKKEFSKFFSEMTKK